MLAATKYHNTAITKYNRSIMHISMYNNINNAQTAPSKKKNNAQTAPALSIAAVSSSCSTQ